MELIFNNIDKIVNIVLMVASSVYIRMLLQAMGQTWIKTVAHTATLTLLPILTYVITNVISGTIALALGMVGALSIVRFRHPVRSPLELSVYFGAITMGITAAVSVQWLLLLVGSVTFVSVILYALQMFFIYVLRKPFFISSFSEGNNLSTLHVVTDQEIQQLDKHDNLMSKSISNGEICYTLASPDFTSLKNAEESLQSNALIKSLQLSR